MYICRQTNVCRVIRLLLYNYLNIRYIYMYISYINKNFRCYKNEINSKNVTIMSDTLGEITANKVILNTTEIGLSILCLWKNFS